MSQILASHRNNTVRFHLLIARPSASDFDSWIRSLAAKNLLELVLRHPSDETLRLPPSFLSFRSLRTAELTNCRLPEDGTGGGEVYFPHLSELTLKRAGDCLLHASPRGPTSRVSALATELPLGERAGRLPPARSRLPPATRSASGASAPTAAAASRGCPASCSPLPSLVGLGLARHARLVMLFGLAQPKKWPSRPCLGRRLGPWPF